MKSTIKILFILVSFFVGTGLIKAQNYDYLIITPDVFLESATWDDDLLLLQSSRGFNPVIDDVPVSTTATQIQTLIQTYYNSNPLQYVLLIGSAKNLIDPDEQIDPGVPFHYVDHGIINPQVDYLNGTYIPFFSVASNNPFDPSGTSNVPTDDPYISGLTSHGPVYIGRVPVNSKTEANNYVSKLSTYYQPSSSYSAALNREILFNQDVTHPTNRCTGVLVTSLNDILINEHIPSSTSIVELNVSEHNQGCDPFTQCQARDQLFEDSLNAGAGVISLLGTGAGPLNLGGWYDVTSNFGLTNINTAMPFLIAPNCTQGAVHLADYDCIMRELMVFNNGGIIGAIAPTHGSEQHANGYTLNRFNDLIYQDVAITYGEIFRIIKDELATNYSLWEYYYNSLTYFGDPSLVPSIYKHRSGTITSSSTWSGNIIIDNSVTVPAGRTLTILPGTTILLENTASFIINGTLNATGTSLNKIVFNEKQTGGNGSLTFDGSASSNSVLDNVEIKNITGIRCLNNANVTIQNSLIDHCTEGVYFHNSQPSIVNNQINEPVQNGINGDASGMSVEILHNTITKLSGNPTYKSYQGIILGNYTSGYIAHNVISGFYWGMYIGGGSYAYLTNASYQDFNPNNLIVDNRFGICAGWGGYIFGSPFKPAYGYNNSIYDNSVYDAKSYHYSNIYARYNWWGTDGAQTYVDGTSTLDASYPLSSDPWSSPEQGSNKLSSVFPSGYTGDDPPESDSNDVFIGLELELEGKISEAVFHYKQMLNRYSVPGFALGRLAGIRKKHSIPNIRGYLVSLAAGNKSYTPIVLTLVAGIFLEEDKYVQAMALYNKIIRKYPNTYYSLNALFEKFFAALNYEKNRVVAGQLLSELQSLGLTDEEFLMRLAIAENLYNGNGSNPSGSLMMLTQKILLVTYQWNILFLAIIRIRLIQQQL